MPAYFTIHFRAYRDIQPLLFHQHHILPTRPAHYPLLQILYDTE